MNVTMRTKMLVPHIVRRKVKIGMTKNLSPTSFIIEGKKVTKPQEMADIMMTTFADKTEKLINDLPPPTVDPCAALNSALNSWGKRKEERELFKFSQITNMDTLKVLSDLGKHNERGK